MGTAARYLAVTLGLTIVLAMPVMAQKKPYGNKEREDIHIYVFGVPNSNRGRQMPTPKTAPIRWPT